MTAMMLAAAAESDTTSWADVVAMGLVLLFVFGFFWLMLR